VSAANPGTIRRVVLNVLSNWGGQAVSLLLSFLVTPFIVTSLGDTAYGVWVLMSAIAGYLGLLDLGVRGAVSRYVARFAASGDDGSASRTVSSAVQIFSAMGGLATLVSLLLALVAIDRLGIHEADRTAARAVLALIGLNVGVSLVSGTWAGTLAALQRFDRLNLVEVVVGTLRTGAMAGAVFAGQGIVAMAAIQLTMSLVRWLWLAELIRRLYPTLRFDLGTFSREHVRLIFAFSVLSFLIHVSGRLIYYTDALVIAAFLPVGLLTFFSIGAALVESARLLVTGVSITTSPMASSLDGTGEHDRIRTLLLTSAKYSMMILLPVATTFLLRGPSFIGLWIGPSYAQASGDVLVVLALPLLFHAGAHGIGGIIMGAGRHKPMVPAMLTEAGANLALSVWLLPTMGIVGVAWGTTIPSIVSSVLFWPWLARHALDVPVASYVENLWIRPWVAVVPFALGTYVVERLWPATTLVGFFAQVGLCLPLALAGDWWICLRGEERAAILARVPAIRVPGFGA
jgi:O-antigen/teichoic acid export membrane protein